MSPSKPAPPGRIRFSNFLFDPVALELERIGEDEDSDRMRVELAPQPAALLGLLIEAAPAFLSRTDIQARIWGDGDHVDPEHALNACIRQLRAALGESAAAPRFIETLPKRGYRFIAQIEADTDESSSVPAKSARANRLVWGGLAVAIVLVLAAFLSIAGPVQRAGSPEVADEMSAEAAEALMRAQAFRERSQPGDGAKSIELYKEALQTDPDLAPAHAGLAFLLINVARAGVGDVQATYAEALEHADKADAVHATADAAIARGYAALYNDYDTRAAAEWFTRAVALEPDNAVAHAALAEGLSADGQADAAVAAADRAAALRPLSLSSRSDRCWYHLFADSYATAVTACGWAIELDPDHIWSQLGLAEAHRKLRQYDQATPALDAYFAARGVSAPPGDVPEGAMANDSRARFQLRACAGARALARKVDEGAKLNAYEIAAVYGVCGDSENAGAWLQRARVEAGGRPDVFFAVDTRFDSVRVALSEPVE